MFIITKSHDYYNPLEACVHINDQINNTATRSTRKYIYSYLIVWNNRFKIIVAIYFPD